MSYLASHEVRFAFQPSTLLRTWQHSTVLTRVGIPRYRKLHFGLDALKLHHHTLTIEQRCDKIKGSFNDSPDQIQKFQKSSETGYNSTDHENKQRVRFEVYLLTHQCHPPPTLREVPLYCVCPGAHVLGHLSYSTMLGCLCCPN